MTIPEIAYQVKLQRNQGKQVVLVTGVFDLLHQEHINFLRKAKAAGDILVVGIESDKRVAQIKGVNRPIDSQAVRLNKLTDLKIIDYLLILPEQFNQRQNWEDFIELFSPAILAISSHSNYQQTKREIMEKFGGSLQIVHKHNPAISTTKILESRGQ